MAKIELKNVTKSYGAVNVIKGVDLTIQKGEFMVFVGPSFIACFFRPTGRFLQKLWQNTLSRDLVSFS